MQLRRPDKNKDDKVEARCTSEQKNAMKRKAELYCGGSISEWIVYASIHFVPGKEDLETVEKKRAPRKGPSKRV